MLPTQLRISNPKVAEAAAEMRAELEQRAASPFANLSPQEHARAQAYRVIDELTPQYEAGAPVGEQLAESLALVGRYEQAADIDPRPEHQAEYREIIEAINRDDDDLCGCPPGRAFVKQDIWSEKHRRVVSLIKCSGCGRLNARSLTTELAAQREHRARAQQLVGGRSPSEAAEILRSNHHTTKQLIK